MSLRLLAQRALWLIVIMILFMACQRFLDQRQALPAQKLKLDHWWGDDSRPSDWDAYIKNSSDIISNKLYYPPETIMDLREQLNRTLYLTEPLEGTQFQYGFNSDELRRIVAYWRDDYMPRWRGREVFLWQFNHLTTELQGLLIHFFQLLVYEENKIGKHHYTVLLLHGWPSSVREFYTLIHELHQTHPSKDKKYIFDVVAPSLPGYAWSQGTSKPGLGPAQIAVIMRNLMLRLGYKKFFIYGSDIGGKIGAHMATLFPENVLGYHSNMCMVMTRTSLIKGIINNITPQWFGRNVFGEFLFPKWKQIPYLLEETGFLHLQATKPDTIGIALTDNPVGLAAYILEKWSTWTNADFRNLPDGGLTKHYELDALLDTVMIYYLTNSITTSQRLHAETFTSDQISLKLDYMPTDVPTGCARFKNGLIHFSDDQLRSKYRNLIHSKFYSKGGHFIALEWPKMLYLDFIEFVKKVEMFNGKN